MRSEQCEYYEGAVWRGLTLMFRFVYQFLSGGRRGSNRSPALKNRPTQQKERRLVENVKTCEMVGS
jgi:hypothetical protein